MGKREQLKVDGHVGEAADWRASSLWRSLEMMRIEPAGAVLTFTGKLAGENGWSHARAQAVVEEYRRFLYLAAVVGPVTPSEDVDQAWHLHLTCSRHYWDQLCGVILGRPLHHDPTTGGPAEARRFAAQYAATLRRYREIFGAAPPADIWPGVAQRLSGGPRRVDIHRYWLVPKRLTSRATLVLGSLPLAACAAGAVNGEGSGIGLFLLGLLIVMALIAGLILYGIRQDRRWRDDAGGCGVTGGWPGGSNDCDGPGGCGGGCGGD